MIIDIYKKKILGLTRKDLLKNLLKVGINLRNFHHCTKHRKLQFFGQKGVAKGCGNWFCQVFEGGPLRTETV